MGRQLVLERKGVAGYPSANGLLPVEGAGSCHGAKRYGSELGERGGSL